MTFARANLLSMVVGAVGVYVAFQYSLIWGITISGASLIWRLEQKIEALENEIHELRENKQDKQGEDDCLDLE